MLKFKDFESWAQFLEKRVALKATKIYLGDDLTPLQVEQGMVQVMEARKAGKWAVHRDGRVIITDKRPT